MLLLAKFSFLTSIGTLATILSLLVFLLQTYKYFTIKRDFLDHSKVDESFLKSEKGYVPLKVKTDKHTIENEKALEGILIKRKFFDFIKFKWKDSNKKNIIIIGSAGAGKSLVLYKFFNNLFSFFTLNLFSFKPPVLLYNLKGKAINQWKNDKKLDNLNKRDRESCVLLIDGFDEYCEAHHIENKNAIKHINEIFNTLDEFKAIVIASRPIEGILQEYNNRINLHICELDEDQVIQVLKKRYHKFYFLFFKNKIFSNLKERVKANYKFLDKKKCYNLFFHLFKSKRFITLKARIEANNKFLLRSICKRPLLLRYVDSFINEHHTISRDQISEFSVYFKNHKFSSNFLDVKFKTRKEFLKQLKKEINTANINRNVREWLLQKINQDKICDKAQQNPIKTDVAIFNHIVTEWHIREATKNKLSCIEEFAYTALMNEVLMQVANYMAKMQLPNQEIPETKLNVFIGLFCDKYKNSYIQDDNTTISNKIVEGLESLGFITNGKVDINNAKLKPSKRSLFRYRFDKKEKKGKVVFEHKSFYNYYLAKYILEKENGDSAKLRILELQPNSEVWKFYADFCEVKVQNKEVNLKYYNLDKDSISICTYKLLRLTQNKYNFNAKNSVYFNIGSISKARMELETSLHTLKKLICIKTLIKNNIPVFKNCIKIQIESKLNVSLLETDSLVDLKENQKYFDNILFNSVDLIINFGSKDFFKFYLKTKPYILEKSKNNLKMTPLMMACFFKSRYNISNLLNYFNGNLNDYLEYQYKLESTALMIACKHRDYENIELLVNAYQGKKNKYLKLQKYDGWTALMFVCRHNCFNSIKLLVNAYYGEKNEYLKLQNNEGWTALMIACRYRNYKCIDLLVGAYQGDKNTYLNLRNNENQTALLLACQNQDFKSINLLLKLFKGNKSQYLSHKTFSTNHTALIVACEFQNYEVIELIINNFSEDKNKYLEVQRRDGSTALIVACFNNHLRFKTIDLLVKSYNGDKSNYLIKVNFNGTALVNAFTFRKNHINTEMIYLLVNSYLAFKNKYLEIKGLYGINVLMFATQYSSLKIISFLLENYQGSKDKYLKEKNEKHGTVLTIACETNTYEVVEFLINSFQGNKSDFVNMKDNYNMTALHRAVQFIPGKRENGCLINSDEVFDQENSANIVKLLLSYGASSVFKSNGYSPKDIAILHGHNLSAKLL